MGKEGEACFRYIELENFFFHTFKYQGWLFCSFIKNGANIFILFLKI
jgi:hypothetical protein